MTDDFNWSDVEDDIAVHGQQTISVYCNPKNNIVIRQESQYHPSEDHWIVINPRNAVDVARAILDRASLEMAIVPLTALRIQNGGGETLAPFGDQETIDAVRNAGRAADQVDDDDQNDDDPAERKRDKAAERQRRRRQKLRERDNHGGSHATDEPNERDMDEGSVTTAPSSPELNFNGGESTALTH